MADRYRIFEITSQEPYLTRDKIVAAMSKKSIKQALWICHDKDRYTEKTVAKERKRLHEKYNDIVSNPDDALVALRAEGINDFASYYTKYHKEEAGELKPKHWHCYITVTPAQEIKTVAKWFDTAPQNVEVKKGAGASSGLLTISLYFS